MAADYIIRCKVCFKERWAYKEGLCRRCWDIRELFREKRREKDRQLAERETKP